jgi:hypothetical protein
LPLLREILAGEDLYIGWNIPEPSAQAGQWRDTDHFDGGQFQDLGGIVGSRAIRRDGQRRQRNEGDETKASDALSRFALCIRQAGYEVLTLRYLACQLADG